MASENHSLSEDESVRAVQGGNPRAFEPLVDAHIQHIRAFVALKAPVSHLVDEITHEAFVYAFRNIQKFKAGTSFRAWLRAIASNLLRAEIQRFAREEANRTRLAEWKHWETSLDTASKHEGREVDFLEQCIEQVPSPMRALLQLKYHDDLSTEEIAQKQNRTLEWVRVSLFRVRQQLKQCIEGKLTQEAP
ncbi:MAG: sigma-70 family RNA polymerase sigma factor [Verrucomicrobiae bacterium]|nr:sigma-70 family RNA polymerase sigma factor [Verrucomicrobiae bacterium]